VNNYVHAQIDIPFLPAHQKPGYETIYHMVQHEQNWYEMKSTTTLKHREWRDRWKRK